MSAEHIEHTGAEALQGMDERGLQIVEDAARTFWTNGIRSVTMDDVARQLGISKKTLYLHVKDKNDLVTKVLHFTTGSFHDHVRAIQEQGLNAIDEMYAIAQFIAVETAKFHPSLYFDLAKYHPEACRIMEQGRQVEVVEMVAANMEKGIGEGLYRDNLNVPLIAKLYVVRFDQTMSMEMGRLTEQYSLAEINWELFRYHIRGIASRKGIDHLEKKMTKAQHM
ncbi:MAG: TetR/AcrR family transcriptional regulator [Flavobacteriales bacterium]|jgi:AcrR family transcriptional regulator|nr:TetR/AcrR family transcriptional regulator [Flavobacteriales bacterium]